ncbi:hypothetical protein ElyMa_000016700 [Elysia marginata]|uniref:Uncharacterized protein n=1 Tax=Elysia marginata TaxID=1093978 RepID=A0AAV4EB74_9GAST|nr:hypothetical protein ElyMa_000016700 [Elysia marginata]
MDTTKEKSAVFHLDNHWAIKPEMRSSHQCKIQNIWTFTNDYATPYPDMLLTPGRLCLPKLPRKNAFKKSWVKHIQAPSGLFSGQLLLLWPSGKTLAQRPGGAWFDHRPSEKEDIKIGISS